MTAPVNVEMVHNTMPLLPKISVFLFKRFWDGKALAFGVRWGRSLLPLALWKVLKAKSNVWITDGPTARPKVDRSLTEFLGALQGLLSRKPPSLIQQPALLLIALIRLLSCREVHASRIEGTFQGQTSTRPHAIRFLHFRLVIL